MLKELLKEFAQFLREYKIVSLAIAFVMGTASTSLVNSFVKDLFFPIIDQFIPGEGWREAAFSLGSVQITYGAFLAELFNFIILAAIIFILAKKILKIDKEK